MGGRKAVRGMEVGRQELIVVVQGNMYAYWLKINRVSRKQSEDVLIHRVFMKNCVFVQEFAKFCDLSFASTGLLLVVLKMASQ